MGASGGVPHSVATALTRTPAGFSRAPYALDGVVASAAGAVLASVEASSTALGDACWASSAAAAAGCWVGVAGAAGAAAAVDGDVAITGIFVTLGSSLGRLGLHGHTRTHKHTHRSGTCRLSDAAVCWQHVATPATVGLVTHTSMHMCTCMLNIGSCMHAHKCMHRNAVLTGYPACMPCICVLSRQCTARACLHAL